MLENYLDWESCNWECTCGHVFQLTLLEDNRLDGRNASRFKAWCNNCAVSRHIVVSEPIDA